MSKRDAQTFVISGKQLAISEIFTYLGSIILFSGALANEIQRRVNLASLAFDRLRERETANRNLTLHKEIAVYDAVAISSILYGCETCVPFRREIGLLESLSVRLRWWNKVTHSEIRSRVRIPSVESMLLHRQLSWLGHVFRMPDSRLLHCVLCGQLRQGALVDK